VISDWIANSDLFQAGGWVLASIAALSVFMWVLIIERYWFLRRDMPPLVVATRRRWFTQLSHDPRINRRLRAGLTSGFRAELGRWIGTIQVITAVLPLLGLLGTVIGMIKTFEVMTIFGSGNVRGMADGISQALVTTMAGLITALGGIYFARDLEERIDRETENMVQRLVVDRRESSR
jgi:biopolymer transport protein ExbB